MLKHRELTDRILRAFYTVYNTLGHGFPEAVYHKSLMIELAANGLEARSKHPLQVRYKGEPVGDFFPDIVVNSLVILELKALASICHDHCRQLANYLKASGMEVGLVLNFGPKPEFERRVFDHRRSLDVSDED